MRYTSLESTLLLVVNAGLAFPQQKPSAPSTDGLALLQNVARHYADAKSYRIEMTEERTLSNAYFRQWTKNALIAAEAPGGLLYFEGRSGFGSAIKVSDGKTEWSYRPDRLRYTAKLVSSLASGNHGAIGMSEMAEAEAGRLREALAKLADPLKSAARLPDSTVKIDGVPVRCEVVRVVSSDEKRFNPAYVYEKTIFIDRKREMIVETVEHAQVRVVNGPPRPQEQDTTTVYSKTMLDGPLPENEFTFSPPKGARLIAEFPDPMDEASGSSLAGDLIPPLKFKDAEGKVVPVESFRGKPVVLDFWATWCAPCVASMQRLAEIYTEGKDKGLAFVSVDQDEDAAKASDFLAKRGYTWPNFHDGDGGIEKLMGSSAIPRTVVVDAKGEVVYDGSGMDENRLRTHLAQLGPEFAELAPKPKKAAPCVASR